MSDDVPPRRHSRNRVTPDGTARLRSVPAALAELSYRSSAQALVQQEAAQNELRSRTGTLLAANAVTASLLGAAALKGGRLDAWLEEFWSSNQATIGGLYPWFTVAAVALAVELVLWAVNLAGIV